MQEARNDMRTLWKAAQEVSMRDYDDEYFTETDFSTTDDFEKRSPALMQHKAKDPSFAASTKPSLSSSTEKMNSDRDFRRRDRSSSLRKLEERPESTSRRQEDSFAPTKATQARRDNTSDVQVSGKTSEISRRHSKTKLSGSEQKGSVNSSTLSMTSSEDKPKRPHPPPVTQDNVKDGTPEYVSYVQSPLPSSSSSPPHPPPPAFYQSALAQQPQSQNLTLTPNDQVIVHTKDRNKPELILDFSDYGQTQQIKVLSNQSSTSASSSPDHERPTSSHNKIKLIKPAYNMEERGDRDVETVAAANDKDLVVKDEDFRHFVFAGYKCSKQTCFFTSAIICCLCLIVIITAIVLIVYFLAIEEDDTTEDDVDDFYTRYQDGN
jgi:hypothetical protein